MKLKKALLAVLFFSFIWTAFSQTADPESKTNVVVEEENNKSHGAAFFFGLTPVFYVNTNGGTDSAVSPIYLPVYIGIAWPDNSFISFQPSLKFSMNYYLVNKDIVMPAEIENRTANALSFLIDLPIAFTLDTKLIGRMQLQAGIAGLIRFGLLANGVDKNDSGYYGTAEEDLKYINSWFFGKMRFLYLSGGFSWLFTYEKVRFGPEASIYLPIAGFFADRSLDGIMLSAGLKIQF